MYLHGVVFLTKETSFVTFCKLPFASYPGACTGAKSVFKELTTFKKVGKN